MDTLAFRLVLDTKKLLNSFLDLVDFVLMDALFGA
jgi:hypothetical protein